MSDIITWNITPQEAWGQLAQAQVDAIEADIVALVNAMLDEVQQWMRENHPWTNRTGAAEAGLYTDIEHAARESVYLLMSHGPAVSYAWYLEHSFGGRFSVLGDTSDRFWPVLYRGALEIARRHSG